MTARAAFSADEVAEMYGISESLVRQMTRDGRLAKVPHLGRTIRISWTELERVLGPLPEQAVAS